jgi:hypothetical protein
MTVSAGQLDRTSPTTPASQRRDYAHRRGTTSSRQPAAAPSNPCQASAPAPQRPDPEEGPRPGVGEECPLHPLTHAGQPMAPPNGPCVSSAVRPWELLGTSHPTVAQPLTPPALALTALGVG